MILSSDLLWFLCFTLMQGVYSYPLYVKFDLMPTSQSYQFIFIQIMFRALKFLDVSDCLVLVSQIEKIVMRSQFIDE